MIAATHDDMEAEHTFGGQWTEEKLARLNGYLNRYRVVMKNQHFTTWYVDAFAGTGSRSDHERSVSLELFQDVYDDPDSNRYRQGSATIALNLEDPFERYLFVDRRKKHVKALEASVSTCHPQLLDRCQFEPGDANEVLRKWCAERDWYSERAVVFLDPYGMQVEWKTIMALASTHGVDLWYLFPLGIGVSRLLTRDGEIDESWQNRLNSLFGTPEWRTRFYNTTIQPGLFGDVKQVERNAPAEKIQAFIEERLATCFLKVARGLILYNSRSNPLYSLCFAASNPKGAPIALRIVRSILEKDISGRT